jgi:alkylhydroperoxidase family enzyme
VPDRSANREGQSQSVTSRQAASVAIKEGHIADTHFSASTTEIARLQVPASGHEDDSVRDLVVHHHGDNCNQTLAVNPDTVSRVSHYFEHLFRQDGARLPQRERELIAVVVSAKNGCGLCEVHHTPHLATRWMMARGSIGSLSIITWLR